MFVYNHKKHFFKRNQNPLTPKSFDALCTQTPAKPQGATKPCTHFFADISHSFQITQHKLNGKKFQEWCQSVLVIKGKGKMCYLTGDISTPKLYCEDMVNQFDGG